MAQGSAEGRTGLRRCPDKPEFRHTCAECGRNESYFHKKFNQKQRENIRNLTNQERFHKKNTSLLKEWGCVELFPESIPLLDKWHVRRLGFFLDSHVKVRYIGTHGGCRRAARRTKDSRVIRERGNR